MKSMLPIGRQEYCFNNFCADEEMKAQVFAQNLPGIRRAETELRNSDYLVLEVASFTSNGVECWL